MMKAIVIFTALIVSVLGVDDNSISSILHNKEEVAKIEKTLQDPTLFHRDVCSLTKDDMETLKNASVQYTVTSMEINYKTGTANFKNLDKILDKNQKDNLKASICDEEYNMQTDMDSKIAFTLGRYLSREGNCGLPGRKEACKEVEEPEEEIEKERLHKNRKSQEKNSKKII